MIIVTLRMVVRPEARDELLKSLKWMLEPTRVEPGCISFYFYQDVEDENAFILVEEWETKEDLDRHIRGDNYRKLLVLTDLLSEPPEIKFNTVSRTQGLEYIEEILGLNGN